MIFKWKIRWFLLKPGVQTTWVIKMKQNRLLNCLLPFRFIFCIDAFYEVAFSKWKKWNQKAWGSCMQLPQSWGLWWIFLSLCSRETCILRQQPPGRAELLPSGPSMKVPRNWEEMSLYPVCQACRKGEEFFLSFSSLALICQGNVIRVCLVLKYKLGRSHKCVIALKENFSKILYFKLAHEI